MTEENLIFTPDITKTRNTKFSIDSAIELYSLSHKELLKCGFKKFISNTTDINYSKLYLFPRSIYNLIPNGFIIQEINYTGRWKNKIEFGFKPFKYEEDYFSLKSTLKEYEQYRNYSNKLISDHGLISEHLYIGININYTYNELLIKTIIE